MATIMNKTSTINMLPALMGVLLMLLASCGNSNSTTGSWGAYEVNTNVYLELYPSSINIDVCNASADVMVANVLTSKISQALPDNTLTVDGYTLMFNASGGAPPIDGDSYAMTRMLPATGVGLLYIDAGIKSAFLNDINSGAYPTAPVAPTYTAAYSIYGSDLLSGKPRSWGTRSEVSFKMGRGPAICVPRMMPVLVSVKAVAWPDKTTSDDITFYISGGTAPYRVTSDSPLINSPGYIPEGSFSFMVDPDYKDTPATVTLTLIDAAGQQAISTVDIY